MPISPCQNGLEVIAAKLIALHGRFHHHKAEHSRPIPLPPAAPVPPPWDSRTCRQELLAADRAISRLRRGLLTSLELAHLPHQRDMTSGAILRRSPDIAVGSGPRPIARRDLVNEPPALGERSDRREPPPLAAAVEQRLSLLRVTNLGTLLDILA